MRCGKLYMTTSMIFRFKIIKFFKGFSYKKPLNINQGVIRMKNIKELKEDQKQLRKVIEKFLNTENETNKDKVVTNCIAITSSLAKADFWLNESGLLDMLDTKRKTNGKENLKIKRGIYEKDLKELLKAKNPEGVEKSIRELKVLCKQYVENQDRIEMAEEV